MVTRIEVRQFETQRPPHLAKPRQNQIQPSHRKRIYVGEDNEIYLPGKIKERGTVSGTALFALCLTGILPGGFT